jgi:hypothetical protein
VIEFGGLKRDFYRRASLPSKRLTLIAASSACKDRISSLKVLLCSEVDLQKKVHEPNAGAGIGG